MSSPAVHFSKVCPLYLKLDTQPLSIAGRSVIELIPSAGVYPNAVPSALPAYSEVPVKLRLLLVVLIVPFTSNLAPGVIVPTPTLPESKIANLLELPTLI